MYDIKNSNEKILEKRERLLENRHQGRSFFCKDQD